MFNQITANELKVKGIQAVDEMMEETDGVVVTVRGRERYVIIPVEEYHQLRELELDSAIAQTRKEIESGEYVADSIGEHLRRIDSDV